MPSFNNDWVYGKTVLDPLVARFVEAAAHDMEEKIFDGVPLMEVVQTTLTLERVAVLSEGEFASVVHALTLYWAFGLDLQYDLEQTLVSLCAVFARNYLTGGWPLSKVADFLYEQLPISIFGQVMLQIQPHLVQSHLNKRRYLRRLINKLGSMCRSLIYRY